MLCKSVHGVYKVDVTEVVALNLPCMSVCNECSLERELETIMVGISHFVCTCVACICQQYVKVNHILHSKMAACLRFPICD